MWIIQVSVALRSTVCGDVDRCLDNLSGHHHQSVKLRLSVDSVNVSGYRHDWSMKWQCLNCSSVVIALVVKTVKSHDVF